MNTELGAITCALFDRAAPQSVAGFLRAIKDAAVSPPGHFHRSVRGPQNDCSAHPIHILQGAWAQRPGQRAQTIVHETTHQTGLLHIEGSLSLGRDVNGASGAEFFICLRDHPALDYRGGRDPYGDGLGFAVIGRVTSGMDIVRSVHALPLSNYSTDPYTRGQLLMKPLAILSFKCFED